MMFKFYARRDGSRFRVWRSGWPSGWFEVMTEDEFYTLSDALERFNLKPEVLEGDD